MSEIISLLMVQHGCFFSLLCFAVCTDLAVACKLLCQAHFASLQMQISQIGLCEEPNAGTEQNFRTENAFIECARGQQAESAPCYRKTVFLNKRQ